MISDTFVQALRAQSAAVADVLLAQFHPGEPQELRGREQPVAVWIRNAPGT